MEDLLSRDRTLENEEYPQDYFVKIENDPHRIGRITINRQEKGPSSQHPLIYNIEIDIVGTESKKIWYHVDRLFNFEDKNEGIDAAVQRLAQFLRTSSN